MFQTTNQYIIMIIMLHHVTMVANVVKYRRAIAKWDQAQLNELADMAGELPVITHDKW